MKTQVKKTKNASKTRVKLHNDTGRPWPMTPKAGVTKQRSRYKIGGKCNG